MSSESGNHGDPVTLRTPRQTPAKVGREPTEVKSWRHALLRSRDHCQSPCDSRYHSQWNKSRVVYRNLTNTSITYLELFTRVILSRKNNKKVFKFRTELVLSERLISRKSRMFYIVCNAFNAPLLRATEHCLVRYLNSFNYFSERIDLPIFV